MVVLDAMEKTAGVRVLQTELNDRPGVCLKLLGSLGYVQAATATAEAPASAMRVEVIAHVIPAPAPEGNAAYEAAGDYNPLFQQATVQYPEQRMKNESQAPFAVGLIETQGFTAVF